VGDDNHGKLLSASGRVIPIQDGLCLWCNQYVYSDRVGAGCTDPFDPAWATGDGDYGCDESPVTNDEACGSHARPYDLARLLLCPPGAT